MEINLTYRVLYSVSKNLRFWRLSQNKQKVQEGMLNIYCNYSTKLYDSWHRLYNNMNALLWNIGIHCLNNKHTLKYKVLYKVHTAPTTFKYCTRFIKYSVHCICCPYSEHWTCLILTSVTFAGQCEHYVSQALLGFSLYTVVEYGTTRHSTVHHVRSVWYTVCNRSDRLIL